MNLPLQIKIKIMSKCTKCGAEIAGGNAFCSRCGTKAKEQTSTQPQAPNPPQPVSSPPPPKSGMSTAAKVIIIVLVTLFVLGAIGVVAGYFLVKKGIEKATDEYNKIEEEWSDEMESLKELEEVGDDIKEGVEEQKEELEKEVEDNTPSTETKNNKPTKKASKVVEEFMACTLGTIPQSCPSDNKDSIAKSHLTLEMRADYNSDTFIPYTYCIQMGPDNVKIESETATGNFSYVTVSAKYGTDDYYPMWMFTLIIEDGEWKIKEIQCLNYEVQ